MFNYRLIADPSKKDSVVEILETRVLYSADAILGLLPLVDEVDEAEFIEVPEYAFYAQQTIRQPVDDTEADTSSSEGAKKYPIVDALTENRELSLESDESDRSSRVSHLVIIDHEVVDSGVFFPAMHDKSMAVITIGATDNAIQVITESLKQFNALASVQIISHGASGELHLGNGTVTTVTLAQNIELINSWKGALNDDADILLLGCNVAYGAEGEFFVKTLAALSDADVAGSTNATGHQDKGGDWDLEFVTGPLESGFSIEPFLKEQWNHVLATITPDTFEDQFDIDEGTTLEQLITLQAAGEEVSLREAVYAAQQGADGLDIITLMAGIYKLDREGTDDDGIVGDLNITDDTTIQGVSSSSSSIENTLDDYRVIQLHDDSILALNDVTITGGDARYRGGGLSGSYESTISLQNAVVLDNESGTDGGGIYTKGSLIVQNSTISGNASGQNGGGVYAERLFDISNSQIINNTSDDNGGGVYGVNVSVANSVISGNYAGHEGSGVFAQTSVIIQESEVSGNQAEDNGGGVYTGGTYTIVGSTFSGNSSITEHGGGLYGLAVGTVTDSTFKANSAIKDGGGIYARTEATLSASYFSGNAGRDGGAIYSRSDDLFVVDSHFQNNNANDRGGALFSRSNLEIQRSSFLSNAAPNGQGGAVYMELTYSLSVDNSTFHANSSVSGGAIATTRNGIVENSTFVANTATSGASAIWADGVSVEYSGTLFAENLLNGAIGGAVNSSTVSNGFNLFDYTQTENPTDLNNTDPGLNSLEREGFVVAYTLAEGSPAINSGKTTLADTTDSQLNERDEIADIGASEFGSDASVIFWTDLNGDIFRSDVEFSNVQLIVDTSHDIEGFAVDSVGSRVYWLNGSDGQIYSASMDGIGDASIFIPDSLISGVTGLGIDAAAAHMYLSFGGGTPRIDRYDLSSGNFQSSIVTTGIANPVDIEIVPESGRIYWVERGSASVSESVRSTDFSGGDLDYFNTGRVDDLAVDFSVIENTVTMYWSQAEKEAIVKYDVSLDSLVAFPVFPETGPDGLVFDELSDRLIWTSNDSGTILTTSSDMTTIESRLQDTIVKKDVKTMITSRASSEPDVIRNATLVVVENEAGLIDASVLMGSDDDTPPDQLVFQVVSEFDEGFLTVEGVPKATQFTQAQVSSGLVSYTHEGGEIALDEMELVLTDTDSSTEAHLVRVRVTPVNDSPVLGTDQTLIVPSEGAIVPLDASLFSVSDPDNEHKDYRYRYTSDLTAGSLFVYGVALPMNVEFSHEVLMAGGVMYEHSDNDEEIMSEVINFVVSDGMDDSAPSGLQISINASNDTPTLLVGSEIQANENTSVTLSILDLSANDPDTELLELEYRITSSLLAGSVQVSGVGEEPQTSFTHSQLINEEVRYFHHGGEIFSESIDFVVSDGESESDTKTLLVDIQPVNDAPLFIAGPTVILDEASTHTISLLDLSVSDPDSDTSRFEYRYVSDLIAGRIEVNGDVFLSGEAFTFTQLANNEVVYLHEGDEEFDESIDFIVSDGEAESNKQTLSFEIQPLNDAPVLLSGLPVSLDEGREHVLTSADLSMNDVDSNIADVTYRYTSELVAGRVEVGGVVLSRESTFTHAQLANSEVVYVHGGEELFHESIDFIASDGASDSLIAQLTLRIIAQNDMPELLLSESQPRVREGGDYVWSAADLYASDNDNSLAELNYGYVSGPLTGSMMMSGEPLQVGETFNYAQLVSGEVVYQHDGSESIEEEIAFVVSDGTDFSVPVMVRMDIESVNDSPTIRVDGGTVPENMPGAPIAIVFAADEDLNDVLTISVSDNRFTVVNEILSLKENQGLNYEEESEIELQLVATDSEGAGVIEDVVLQVLDENDRPFVGEEPQVSKGDGYRLPSRTFIDPDGDSLSYIATLPGGEALPTWLEFDDKENTFSVINSWSAQSSLVVTVYADDGRGGQSSVDIMLQFEPNLASATQALETVASATEVSQSIVNVPVARNEVVSSQVGIPQTAAVSDVEPDAVDPDVVPPDDGGSRVVGDQVRMMEFASAVDLHTIIKTLPAVEALEFAEVELSVQELEFSPGIMLHASAIDSYDLSGFLQLPQSEFRRFSDTLLQGMDQKQDEQLSSLRVAQVMSGTSAGVSTGLSVGYIIWLIRSGALMGSVLSSLPAWKFIDPLPVLSSLAADFEDDDDESLEALVSKGGESSPLEQHVDK